jgi:hypothetical protein
MGVVLIYIIHLIYYVQDVSKYTTNLYALALTTNMHALIRTNACTLTSINTRAVALTNARALTLPPNDKDDAVHTER